ncbi:MAG: glycosyltransferase family 4 protein [Fimbriimonadales bacterium]|nr:glycosyltransferase family 4 protein [Fimbriimonadales bacterium]
MRIVHLAAGAGPMYCGACKRDVALARALRELGHEVLIVPLYTPLRLERAEDVPFGPMGFGGISVYLASSAVYRALPAFLRRTLDAPWLVRLATSRASAVDARRLGALTVGVLRGLEGPQAACWKSLEAVLRELPKPDWVTITNSMLGAASEVVDRVWGVPCACFLQGEETFLDATGEPYRSEAWRWVGRWAEGCRRLLATHEASAEAWALRLGLERSRFGVVPPCLPDEPSIAATEAPDLRHAVCVGVVQRAKGQDLLLDAMEPLLRDQGWRLTMAGRVMDRRFGREIGLRMNAWRRSGSVQSLGEIEPFRRRMLQATAGVGAVPSRIPEARGLAALEFLAYGVPVVAPRCGIFPEIADRTEGVVLFETANAASLREALLASTHDRLQSPSARLHRAEQTRAAYSGRSAARALLAELT